MFTIEYNDGPIQNALSELDEVLDDITSVFQEMGEYMVGSMYDRITAGTALDGSPFAPKSETTMALYRKKGEGIDSRPLIHTGQMSNDGLHYSFTKDTLRFGSSEPYAAVQHFGAAKGAFGAYSGVSKKNGRRYAGSSPWGDIPARPFVGLSEQDEAALLDIVTDALRRTLK